MGLALGDRLGEVDRIMEEGILTGDDDFFGFPRRSGDDDDDTNNESVEYFSGIFTGVEGLRGLTSPLLGLSGCGRERRGRGLVTGLGRGVLGVRVSELDIECNPVNRESKESVGLIVNPVHLSGIKYLLFCK